MRTFSIRSRYGNPKIVAFGKSRVTCGRYCGVCRSWTCGRLGTLTKAEVRELLRRRPAAQTIKVGCTRFRPEIVAYARRWVKMGG